MADKRGEMAEEFRKVMGEISVTAAQKDLITRALELNGKLHFSAGSEQMRERAAQLAHGVLHHAPPEWNLLSLPDHIRALPLDPKEAQDADG